MDDKPPTPTSTIQGEQEMAMEIARALVPIVAEYMKTAPGGESFEYLVALFGKDDGTGTPVPIVWLSGAPVRSLVVAADVLRTSFTVQLREHARALPHTAKA